MMRFHLSADFLSLFDLPISSIATSQPDGRIAPSHVPPLSTIQAVETSLNQFRARIPPLFAYNHGSSGTSTPSDGMHTEVYDGFNDPWWIMLHTNLYTAEVMMWKETAHYQAAAYSTAVGCARAMVAFVAKIRQDQWTHVGTSSRLTCPSICAPHSLRRKTTDCFNRYGSGNQHLALLAIPLQGVRPASESRRSPRSHNGSGRSRDLAPSISWGV